MNSWRYNMWVYVKHPDGSTEEREFPAGVYLEIGDILEDGAVVIDVPYTDGCCDDDIDALMLYDD
ncbi:MAG TPA: hypothetical protein PLN60_04185 [Bacillota bacterium]|nr:hypothetical protein [Bacillota bacterium]HQE09687.1 hypothetical protein [Bacillota bacterium]